MREQLILTLILSILGDWLNEYPSPKIIERAQALEVLFPDGLPDWVGVLAGGNPAALDSVIDIAKGEMESDNASDL